MMNRYFRYLLLLIFCIFLTGCRERNDDFAAVNDTAEVHETQPEQAVYWQKQIDVNGANVAQIVINAKIGGMRTDSLYEVVLNRRNLDAKYAEETVARLMDSYEKEDAEQEDIYYTGLWDNQPCEFRVYDTSAYFYLSNYRNGLYHFPEGEWEGATPTVSYIVEENNSKISSKEAEQIGDGFLEKLGLDAYGLAKIEDLYWEPVEHLKEGVGFEVETHIVGSIPENTWCEGYVLTYARDIKGVLQDIEGYWHIHDTLGAIKLGEADNIGLEEITLYVTDFGVVDAWISQLCDAKEHSLEGEQVIELETAKEKFEEILLSDPNRFADAVSDNRLEFNSLELVYYADAPDHISPVWKLSNFAKPNWERYETSDEEAYQEVILIHAITGKEIDLITEAFIPYDDESYYKIEVEEVPASD